MGNCNWSFHSRHGGEVLRGKQFHFVLFLIFLLTIGRNTCAEDLQKRIVVTTDLKLLLHTENGCKIWLGGVDKNAKVVWSGACLGGMADGDGVLDVQWQSNQLHYEGGTKSGKFDGHGTEVLPNGDSISGEFHQGFATSPVIFKRHDGYSYEGGWAGREEGLGRALWPSGGSYEGNWHLGQPDGKGTLVTKGGSKYVGNWRAGKQDGVGTLTFYQGGFISGDWKDNFPNGHVIWVTPTGDRYDGEVKNGKRNGIGVYLKTDGDRYEGEWRDGLPNGQGTWTARDGASHSGLWRNGCFLDDKAISRFVDPSKC